MNKAKFNILLSMTIFGTIGLVRKYIPYSSTLVAFARAVIGTVFLLIVHAINKERFDLSHLKGKYFLIISGILLGFNWILLFEAYRYTSVSVATISYYMAPVIVVLLSPICFKEKLTAKKLICFFIAFVGMIFVSGVLETGFTGIKGVLFGLCAAMMYAAIVIMNRFVEGISSNDRTIIQLGLSAISLFPYLLMTEDLSTFNFSLSGVIMLLVAGIIHTGFAYALYFGNMAKAPAQTVAILSYIDPIVAVVLSAVVLKEKMTLLVLLGVIMVISGAICLDLGD